MRVSELLSLRPADVNLEASYLTCTGKGDKQRIVPIGDEAGDVGERDTCARRGRRCSAKRTSPRLFVNARGGGPGLTRVGFWKILKGYARQAGCRHVAQPAHAAALVCDAPARTRRRPARDPDDARARRPVDDADLHARARAADAQRSTTGSIPAHETLRRSSAAGVRRGCRRRVCLRCRHVPQTLAGTRRRPAVRGAIHVHTRRSDGTGTPEEWPRPRPRAGLKFVILTDHGDGTREPARPAYRNGVLFIDAVEISTEDGHVVALGLPQTPYPLGGEARDVVEDVARLGGMSIAAHPGSPKPSCAGPTGQPVRRPRVAERRQRVARRDDGRWRARC